MNDALMPGAGNGGPAALLAALEFAAHKHRRQRRKDSDATPYINHPIAVAAVLARIGGITDLAMLQAALLHDTLEDTDTTPAELEKLFGADVRALVEELTDDKRLARPERRARQLAGASALSTRAKQIKIADKICNGGDIDATQPPAWSLKYKTEYLEWAAQVVDACRGCNAALEQHFDALLAAKRAALAGG